MVNKPRHRRFGNIRKRAFGRYQIRYPGPDGRMRAGPETYERKSDAERAVSLIEAQMISGEWADSDRSKIKLQDYAAYWIAQRAGLRPRTVDLYTWLCGKHINPHLGGVPLGRLTTPMIREWRAKLLRGGVSVSMAAKAYRLLRSILTTAVEEDKILPRNPGRVRGAGTELTPERPVLTVAQVFELAELVGRRPVGNIRRLPAGQYRLRYRRYGVMRTAPEVYSTRWVAEAACGPWARTAGQITTTTAATAPWCSWPPSPACAGERQPRFAAATWTWPQASCECAPPTLNGQPGNSCWALRSRGQPAASLASRHRSSPPCVSTYLYSSARRPKRS